MQLITSIKMANQFIPSVIYADDSGLSDDDLTFLDDYIDRFCSKHGSCHVIIEEQETEFCRDDITGLMADCVQASLYIG